MIAVTKVFIFNMNFCIQDIYTLQDFKSPIMKHVVLFFFIPFCFFEIVNAQAKISLGLKLGSTIPGIGLNSSNPIMDGYKNQLAPCYGVVLETGLNKKWSLLNEVNYTTIKIKKNGGQVIPKSIIKYFNLTSLNLPDDLYANFESNININYFEVPIMLKYFFHQTEKFNCFANGGFFVGTLVNGNINTKGQGNVYSDAAHTNSITPFPIFLNTNINVQNWLNDFNYGFQGGLGCTLKFNTGEIFANLSGSIGFNNMQINKDDGENKSREGTLCVGYLIHLSK